MVQSGIQHYRRKPTPAQAHDIRVARYQPGQPLDDLLAVARMEDQGAQLAEVRFGDLAVLVVRYTRDTDHGPSEPEYEHVKAGDYLGYREFLFDTDDADLRQWYDLAEG